MQDASPRGSNQMNRLHATGGSTVADKCNYCASCASGGNLRSADPVLRGSVHNENDLPIIRPRLNCSVLYFVTIVDYFRAFKKMSVEMSSRKWRVSSERQAN